MAEYLAYFFLATGWFCSMAGWPLGIVLSLVCLVTTLIVAAQKQNRGT